jgi:hypothetical protein
VDHPFRPSQADTPTPTCAEGVVHAARTQVEEVGSDGSYGSPTFDFRNAFNVVSRAELFRVVAREAPALVPWVVYCYGTASNLTYDGQVILSSSGLRQGDPLAPPALLPRPPPRPV